MDTKHSNASLDPTTIAGQEPSLQPAGTEDGDADSAEAAADAPDPKAAKTRPPRPEYVIRRTSGRLMHQHRGRR